MASNKPPSESEEDVFKESLQPMPPKGKLETRVSQDTRVPISRQSSGLEFMKPAARDGRDNSNLELIVMITKETQTDWEWADMHAKQTAIEVKDGGKGMEIDPTKPITPPPVVTPLENVREEGIQVDMFQKKSISIAIQAFEETADDVVPEPYMELKITKEPTRIIDTPATRKHGGATPVQEPWPPKSPLYGRPIIMFDDEDLDLMDSPQKEQEVDNYQERDAESLLEGMSNIDGKLPRLGLPTSLQVRKDSTEPSRARNRQEFQQLISEPAAHPADAAEDGTSSDASFANLVCEFCANPLRPFPTLEQQRTTSSSELYCCDDYRKFVEFVLATDDSFEQQLKNKLLGLKSEVSTAETSTRGDKPGEPAKSKAAKSLNRNIRQQNNDDERRHRQDLERHLAMLEKAKKMRETQLKDGKSVKTINFQLSKYRCFEQGMVILPPEFHLSEMEQFQQRKTQAFLAEQAATYQRRQVVDIEGMSPAIQFGTSGDATVPARHHGEQSYLLDGGVPVIKKYDDKVTTFLILLADGTSTVFYPSGNIAITVSVFNGIRTFTAFEDAPTNETRILAMFMSSGYGSVYSSDGNVRLSLTPAAGFEVNPGDLTRRRRWTWAEMISGSHIHAPPFQCIFYHLNSYLSVRIGDYQDWTLTFFFKQFRCRFNVMAFMPFEVVDSRDFDMADNRLIKLNKYRSQFSESHMKLKALLKEINYMLGLMPPNLSKSLDAGTKDPSPRLGPIAVAKGRKQTSNQQQGNKTARSNLPTFLPPIVNQPVVEVD